MVFADGSIAEYSDSANIIEMLPEQKSVDSSTLLPSWVQNGANAAFFLSSMSKPRHGNLRVNSEQQWVFTPGILLDDLSSKFQQLLDTVQRSY